MGVDAPYCFLSIATCITDSGGSVILGLFEVVVLQAFREA
jgi:hypothetical protein